MDYATREEALAVAEKVRAKLLGPECWECFAYKSVSNGREIHTPQLLSVGMRDQGIWSIMHFGESMGRTRYTVILHALGSRYTSVNRGTPQAAVTETVKAFTKVLKQNARDIRKWVESFGDTIPPEILEKDLWEYRDEEDDDWGL